MTWPEAFAEVFILLIGATAVVLIFCGWPTRRNRDDK